MSTAGPTIADIHAAAERVAGEIELTPCKRSHAFADLVPCGLHLKLENMQRTGSFKERGVINRLSQLTPDEKRRGVVTASAGNHAQALAYHSGRLGIEATVVMPGTTPLMKISNSRKYGAKVVLHGKTFADALEEAHRREQADDLVLVHAFNDPLIVAGQGTAGLEILEQVPKAGVVVVPIGGGGLIAGIALAIHASRPDVRIVGVEAETAATAQASRIAGHIVDHFTDDTIADGVAVKRVGDVTYPIIEAHVADLVTVTEDEIASAILLLLEREKTVAEGAGAVGLAALLAGKLDVDAQDEVVVVVCGGNIDVNMIARIIERGLVFDGRVARLKIKVRDRPGSLARLTQAAARLGANVLDIGHRRAFADISMGEVEIVMHLETRGREHVDQIIADFQAQGLTVEEDV